MDINEVDSIVDKIFKRLDPILASNESESSYRTAIEYCQKLQERRMQFSAFMLSLNAALASCLAFLLKDGVPAGTSQHIAIGALLTIGIPISIIWICGLNEFQIQLSWWFKKIREMEKSRDVNNGIFTSEYDDLFQNRSRERSRMSRYTKILGIIFLGCYTVSAVLVFYTVTS